MREVLERFGSTTEAVYRLDVCSGADAKLNVTIGNVQLLRQSVASVGAFDTDPVAPSVPFVGLEPTIVVSAQGHFETVVLKEDFSGPAAPSVDVVQALARRWKLWVEGWLFFGRAMEGRTLAELGRREEWGAGWQVGQFFDPPSASRPAKLSAYSMRDREGGLNQIPQSVLDLGISGTDALKVEREWTAESTWPGLFPKVVIGRERTLVRAGDSEHELSDAYRAEFDWNAARRTECASPR